MCEKCKRITDPKTEMLVYMKTHEPGTQDEFRQQLFLQYCPVCGDKLKCGDQ